MTLSSTFSNILKVHLIEKLTSDQLKINQTLATSKSINNHLNVLKEFVFDECGFNFSNFKENPESKEYNACSFELDGMHIQYRVSKITPTKTGQFVTIWKRNTSGITEPFDFSDELDFVIITSSRCDNVGLFIFPKNVLAENGIITKNGKSGKRGIRVYPPWDVTTNKQASKTQRWQTNYFLTLKNGNSTDLERAKGLLKNRTI